MKSYIVLDLKNLFTGSERKKISSLLRRADHLRARIAQNDKLSFDKQEYGAIIWALKEIGAVQLANDNEER